VYCSGGVVATDCTASVFCTWLDAAEAREKAVERWNRQAQRESGDV
jgi:hypothetical protein